MNIYVYFENSVKFSIILCLLYISNLQCNKGISGCVMEIAYNLIGIKTVVKLFMVLEFLEHNAMIFLIFYFYTQ